MILPISRKKRYSPDSAEAQETNINIPGSSVGKSVFLAHQVCSFEPHHDKTNKMVCAPNEDSDQSWHPPNLIGVFPVRSMGSYGSKLSSCGQRRLRSDWADAQADLSLRWAHMSFCRFCHEVAHFPLCVPGMPGRNTVLITRLLEVVVFDVYYQ